MANNCVDGISLKVLVDKEKKRVIFAECDSDFVDILFSFMTTPIGTIARLAFMNSLTVEMGCMNSLYHSVRNMDIQHFRTEGYKAMLLSPRNGAESHCKNLQLRIDNTKATKFFLCSRQCTTSDFKLLSYYKDVLCDCGNPLKLEMWLSAETASEKSSSAAQDGGVFVKVLNKYLISEDLQVMPLCAAASIAILSKSGVSDWSTVEERTFKLGVRQVRDLLRCSLISKTPLTESLLNHKLAVPEVNSAFCYQERPIKSRAKQETMSQEQKIYVKLIVSKSRKVVLCAEAKKDFVNLLYSFLTVPLGQIVKKMGAGSSRGCIYNLYKSVQDLDEQCFKSNNHKEMLVSPGVAPGFSYENGLLGIEEASCPQYCYSTHHGTLLIDKSGVVISEKIPLTVMDSKSHDEVGESRGGFLIGSGLFTVTDDLNITLVSPILGLSILSELKVPFSDIEELTVHVGKEEALRLLLYSFGSESALTNAFIGYTEQK